MLYRAQVKISSGEIVTYYIKAPTQCSATKWTAIRLEVEEILYVCESEVQVAEDKITFSTDLDCGDVPIDQAQ